MKLLGTSPKDFSLANLPWSPETEERILPGTSRDALDMPAATTGDDWELLPDEHVRRIRAILTVAANGDSHVTASPWVDAPGP